MSLSYAQELSVDLPDSAAIEEIKSKNTNLSDIDIRTDNESIDVPESADNGISAEFYDSCSDSYTAQLGTRYSAIIESSGAVDWFKLYLPSAGRLSVLLEVPAGVDYDYDIYSSCSTKTGSCYSGGDGADEYCYKDLGAGWAYIKVYGYLSNDYSSSSYYIKGTFEQTCDYSPACTYTDDDDCYDHNTREDWIRETACDGGCTGWIPNGNYECNTGYYCYDPGDAYCASCSASCDGVCTSSNCYGYDPDCTSSGGTVSCCSNSQCGSGQACQNNVCVNTDPYSGVDLLRYWISPSNPVLERGQSFTLYYEIANSRSAVNIGLGASIRDQSGAVYDDEPHDRFVSAASGTYTYSRMFTIPTNAPYGAYDVIWGVHKASGNEFVGSIGDFPYMYDVVSVVPTDVAGQCDNALDKTNGEGCDCWQECSGTYCWGSSSSLTCHSGCAADGQYTYQASECCSSQWDSATGKCYSCGDGTCNGVETAASCPADCNPYSGIDLIDWRLSPSNPVLERGQSFTVEYRVANSKSAVTIGLGASIVDQDGAIYHDQPHDTFTGASFGTYWYPRTFTIPNNAAYGKYDMIWGVHKASGNTFAGEIEYANANDIITVVPRDVPGICDDALSKADGASCDWSTSCNECQNSCAGGTGQCWNPDSCSENQCIHWWLGHCDNAGRDAQDAQYYCDAGAWRECTASAHTYCASYGGYYCTNLNGIWQWRASAPAELCDGMDNDCDGQVDENVNLGTDPNNCGSCNNVCVANAVCEAGQCVAAAVCGDSICQPGERCAKDCLRITRFQNLPSAVTAAQDTTISTCIENIGTVAQTGTVEVAIIPTDFAAQDVSAAAARYVTGCCEANEYYSTVEVTREPGEHICTLVALTAPSSSSYDHCGGSSPASAWGSSFKVIAGAYDACWKDGGTGYYSYIDNPITVNLCSENQCTSEFWGICNDVSTFCCGGDDQDTRSDTEYPQYYCDANAQYVDCNNDVHVSCQLKGSKYCTGNDGLWKFRDCPAGCSGGTCLTQEACQYPYGNSASCSCPLLDCQEGNYCDRSTGYGTCVPIPECGLPDGSSEFCQCYSDADCKRHDPDTECLFGQGFNPCVPVEYEDQCSMINSLKCMDNSLYRCEQQEKYKDWLLLTACTQGQLCSASAQSCISLGSYDLIIDSAPPGVIVNRQPDTIVEVNVRVEGTLGPGMVLEYDANNFDLVRGNACETGTFAQGDNKCFFRVDSVIDKSYIFKFGDDAQRVNIIGNDAYIAYLTDIKQLRNRYNNDNAVNLLLAKLYEEAYANDGVVIDLGTQFAYLDGYGAAHPFNKPFNQYAEDRLFPRWTDNSYSDQVSVFVQDKLSYARNIVVVGDDYVVPHRRDVYSIRAGSLPSWIRGWYNTIKANAKYLLYLPTYGISPTAPDVGELLPDDIVFRNMYTDQNLVQRQVDYTYANLDQMFSIDDSARGNEIKLILPNQVSPEMRSSIENLKVQLVNENLAGETHFEEIQGSTLNCNDFNEFGDWWFFDPLDLPIVIGTVETNPALNCYPVYSAGDFEDVISIEPSVWNGDGAALLMHTDDPKVIDGFANFVIPNGNYKELHGRGYMYFQDTIDVVSLLLIPVSFGTSAAASAGVRGAVLAVDVGVSALDGVSTCVVKPSKPDVEFNWVECSVSASPLGAFGAGNLVRMTRVSSFMRAADGLTQNADELASLRSAATSFTAASGYADDVLTKIPPQKYGDLLRMISKHTAKGELNSQFVKSLGKVIYRSNLKRAAFDKNSELIELIGDVVAKHADASDDVLESIAKIAGKEGDGANLMLRIIGTTDTAWNKGELEELSKFSDDILYRAVELGKQGGKASEALTIVRLANNIDELKDIPGIDRLAAKIRRTIERTGGLKDGEVWEVKGAIKLRDRGEELAALTLEDIRAINEDGVQSILEADVFNKKGDLFSLKEKSWNRHPSQIDYAQLQKSIARDKYKFEQLKDSYGVFKDRSSGIELNIDQGEFKLFFEGPYNSELLNQIEKDFPYMVGKIIFGG
ncbi:MAG TPA: MopE-related protein [Candidatus Nanoarchaeia archaeon]|nr:MopE-related protein [Candidatus Nanoarchaeia archaeon]